MVKLIGGKYRSRVIKTPENGTLPTKNMVRGAMMSMLGERLSGASVLDLFAGSGALGLEAVSRGAASCCLVDASKEACLVLRENVAALKAEGCLVLNEDYLAALSKLKGKTFSVVFLDPPYALKEAYQNSVDYLLNNDMLKEEAAIILEYEGDLPFVERGFAESRRYTYGKSKILLLRR